MNISSTNELINRTSAVESIAEGIASHDDYVVTVPPAALPTLMAALADIPSWHAYLDNGTGLVLRTDRPDSAQRVASLMPTAAVVTVPKAAPSALLSAALGQPVDPDDEQDIVILTEPGKPVCWPMLFIDALDIVSPETAEQLRADRLVNLS